MRLKTLTICVAALAVLSAVVYIAQRPAPPVSKDPRVGQPLAARAVVEKAAKLTISDQGKTVTLTRNSDGTWTDASYFDLPADFSKLSGFVGNLTDAKIDRFVTANPERLDRLEFKDTKIELLDSANKPLWQITVGKSSDVGGGKFIKFDDEKKAYLASFNAWIDTDAKSWANAELIAVKPDDVAKVEIGFPAGAASTSEPKAPATPATTIVVSRVKKDAPWTADQTPANEKVKADKISSVLSSLDSLRFTDTSDLTDPNVAAAKAHEREFKLTTFDGKTYTIAMGRKPEEKKLKPPTEGKSGPAALGKVEDLAKAEKSANGEKKTAKTKPVTPEFETIPAGPVYVFISSSDANAPVNAMMKKRAYQIGDYVFTGLPQKPDELFEPAPAPAPKPEEKKPGEKKAQPAQK